MAIYLVNQSKTYREERKGGFMWSPKLNKAGNQVSGYTLMKDIRKGDYIIHNSGGNLSAISVVQKRAIPERAPLSIKISSKGYGGNDDGWLIETQYYEFQKPIPTSSLTDWAIDNYKEDSAFQRNGKLRSRYLCNLDNTHAQYILGIALANETDEDVRVILMQAELKCDPAHTLEISENDDPDEEILSGGISDESAKVIIDETTYEDEGIEDLRQSIRALMDLCDSLDRKGLGASDYYDIDISTRDVIKTNLALHQHVWVTEVP